MRLIISPVDYGKKRELMADFEYVKVKVPKGFISDGASIPRAFWSIIGHPFGPALEGAVIHDYLYFKGLLTRKECDKLFLEAMKELKVFGPKRWIMYQAVRKFAWLGWNAHRSRERKEKEKTPD